MLAASAPIARLALAALALALAPALACAPRFAPASVAPAGPRATASTGPGAPATPAPDAWGAFWRARGVSPSPPRDFLDGREAPTEIFNRTNGALTDEVVRKWVVADLRRSMGDIWAANHLRSDLIAADVLGPPGLNGTARTVEKERAHGTVRIECAPSPVVAAGVIAVPGDVRERLAFAELTEYVIVLTTRATDQPCHRTLASGAVEDLQRRRPPGTLGWQLDTGRFHEDPVLGPLWYQARGWSCGERGPLEELCALVRPTPSTLAAREAL
jgi:hypothetical protein